MGIYKVTSTLPDRDGKITVTRILEAANVAAARNHVAKDVISVEVCPTAEAMALAASGIKLERLNGAE